jgi:division protein CdvB (Snf7/Vps24/ESCRT-III family)
MALDFSGLKTQARVDALIARLAELDSEWSAMVTSATVSDQGRSINGGAQAQSIIAQREAIRKELALLAGPAFRLSRMKP